jgi:hypothetical protein
VFSRRDKSAEVAEPVDDGVGKGRATPKRSEAERERRERVKGPRDPKARQKFEREKRMEARRKQHEGLMRGDDRYLQKRDAGPRRRFLRDWIDSRFTAAEMFLPSAVLILVLGVIGSKQAQAASVAIWLLVVVLIIIDTFIWVLGLRRVLRQRFPNEPRKRGDIGYAVLRAMLSRRLRTPKPQVKRGQKPSTTPN